MGAPTMAGKAEQRRPGLRLLPAKTQELELISLPLLNPPQKFKDWVLPVLPAFLFAVTKRLM